MSLSRDEFKRLTQESPDPMGHSGTGQISHEGRVENVDLTDVELVQRINERNAAGKGTFRLRFEYERRLKQRGL